MATMLTSSCAPSSVPRVTASTLLVASLFSSMRPPVGAPSAGTMSAATAIAAGAERIEATSRCATTPGTRSPRMARVEKEHRAGDRRHAHGHQREQLAARDAREPRSHEQRRLDHADEDVGRGGQPEHAADAERALEQPGDRAHDGRQDAPVKQQRRQRAHHQHDRQGLEGEDEARTGVRLGERQRAAAEIAEDEGRAGARRRLQREQQVVQREERVLDDGQP